MNEREFIRTLEERASEQEKIIKSVPLPEVFSSISVWLGNHPWRLLIPFSFIITYALHIFFGKPYDDFILDLFGKL